MNLLASNNSLNASGSLRPNFESESILELQKILADEKKRAAEHKFNYQQIKSELNKLQENHARLEDEFAECTELRKVETAEYQMKISQLSRKLVDSQREIEDLRVNQVTEKRIEMIRLKIEEQFESVYHERLARCSSECDAIKTDMMKLRTENTFLKSEFDHQHKEHNRIIEEIKLIHQSEVATLKSDKARLLACSMDIPQESCNLKEVSKENNVLRSQIKSLLNELQEARSKMEHDRTNYDQELRAKHKQLSDTSSTCRKMELEIESLKQQHVTNQKELASWNTENSNLQFNSNELDRANRMLQNRLDELTQKAKVDLTQLKLESAKQKGDIERQKDLLSARIEELEYQLRLAGTKCGQLETQLQEREISIARREASIKETEWARVQQLENEKLELESQISNLESMLREEKNSISGKLVNLEEKARNAEQKERVADKEREIAKHKYESSVSEIRNYKVNLNEAKSKIIQQEAELDECYNRLAISELAKKEKKDLQQQVIDLSKQLKDITTQHDNVMADKDVQSTQDRSRYQQRIKELEEELSKSLEKTRLLQDELRRKNKKHSNYFLKQKKQLQLITAMKDEMGAEMELLKNNVPAEDFQKLTRELKDLRKRHQEYRNIIMQSANPASISVGLPLHESRYEQSLEQLKKRLEILDEKQQQQLPEVLQLQEVEKGDFEKSKAIFGPHGDNI